MSTITECPRCGCGSYERLTTHAYCANCNYSPTYELTDHEMETLEGVDKLLQESTTIKQFPFRLPKNSEAQLCVQ